jgi:ankyrin repeat protein
MKNLINSSRLIRAVRDRKYLTVKIYIALGADVNCKDKAGMTPLMHSIALADLKMMEILLRRGASVTDRDNDGWTAAMWAQFRGDDSCIKKLRSLSGPLLYNLTDDNPHAFLGLFDMGLKIKI